jgi:30S ribosomal protein S31
MGKGDKKTKRGKIVNKSYGVRRPRKVKKNTYTAPPAKEVKEEKPKAEPAKKKAPAKKTAKKTTAKKTTAKKPKAAAKPKEEKEK